jgi:hypothetical protein
MYAEWKKALDVFQEQEGAFYKWAEDVKAMLPMIDMVNATVPALIQALPINLDRFRASARSMRAVLKKMEERKELTSEDQSDIRQFLAERQRIEEFMGMLKQEYEKAVCVLQGKSSMGS